MALYKFPCCNCGQCKRLYYNYDKYKGYKIDKKSKKEKFAKAKNGLRRSMHKRWITKLRRRDPLKSQYPQSLYVGSYSD